MAKTIAFCLLICCFLSCHFTWRNSGDVFVNQRFMETRIQEVFPAEHIEMSLQTTDNHDSVLIVKLTVNPRIPNDSLTLKTAKIVLNSFIGILPNMSSYKSCDIYFIKNENYFVSKSVGYSCLITPQLVTAIANYKDSTRLSRGYMDTGWAYVNADLNLSLPLKHDWFYVSLENDSNVFYHIGSDVNELPQYRTETDRKVTFETLDNLDPGESFPVVQISKNNKLLTAILSGRVVYNGPAVSVGLVINRFDSEDEYLKAVYQLAFIKKLSDVEIQDYHFGNTKFRGHRFEHKMKNGKMAYYIYAIKRFRKVSLVLNLIYSEYQELEEIKRELSGLEIK